MNDSLPRSVTGQVPAATTDAHAPGAGSPYKGLRPYDPADRDRFFGRDRESKVTAAHLIATRLTVLYGASEEATLHFELHEGDRVAVERRLHGWALVSTANGKRGWARRERLLFVGPPYDVSGPATIDRDEEEHP